MRQLRRKERSGPQMVTVMSTGTSRRKTYEHKDTFRVSFPAFGQSSVILIDVLPILAPHLVYQILVDYDQSHYVV